RRFATLTNLPDLGPVGQQQREWQENRLAVHDRVFAVPDAKALGVVAPGGDALHGRRFDPEGLAGQAGADYPLVVNKPPVAARGVKFAYAPEVLSKAGGVSVAVEAGPEGMKSEGGAVTWDVPDKLPGDEQPVVLLLSDASGRQAFHAIKVVIGQ